MQDDGSFLIRGDADLEDCDAILGLNLEEGEQTLKDFATLSGFLCMCAGEIPHTGDFVMHKGWCFEVLSADDKKILQLQVDRLLGAFDEDDEEEGDQNKLRSFLKRNLGADADEGSGVSGEALESAVEDELERTRARNQESAMEVERMVEAGKEKLSTVENALTEVKDSATS